jgi:anti-sigma factor RsiW
MTGPGETAMVPEGCDRLRVTAFVDGALTPAEREIAFAHIASCPRCLAQRDAESALRAAVRALPPPALPHGLASRVRRRSRKPVPLRPRVWVPALAALLLVVVWAHGASSFVAWQVALDHAHCFGKPRLPAEILTGDPGRLAAWFAERGTELPLVPASAGGLDLVGGRFCPLLDRRVAHVYYGGSEHQVSLYVIPGPVRFDRSYVWAGAGTNVNLLRVAGSTVGLVGSDPASLAAIRRSLKRTVAENAPTETTVTTPPALW